MRFKWYDVKCDKDGNSKFKTDQTTKHVIIMQFLNELDAEDRKLCTKVEKSIWAPHLWCLPCLVRVFNESQWMHKSLSIFNTISDIQRLMRMSWFELLTMQLTNLQANNATGGDLEPGPCLRRVGAQGVAPRWFWKGQAPSGWRPGGSGEGRRPVGGAQVVLERAGAQWVAPGLSAKGCSRSFQYKWWWWWC